ncbi:MAG: flagellar hook-associated protein FlgK, partial [Phycisphaerales bacterium]|nr:flagellar hook-associated protein FlgK [Phycisphaerales bacterium]
MSLSAALQIGRSALTASQVGLQVTGNNMANAATPGYSRQVTHLLPARSDSSLIGARIGRGVNVGDVQRQIDQALQSRLWSSMSDEHASLQEFQILAQAEAMLNELSDADLSSQLSEFFDTWSEATNLQQSASVVIGQGSNLAAYARNMREDLTNLRAQIDGELRASIERADALLSELAALDVAVVEAETHASANALRDQRDMLVSELSEFLDINVVEQSSGHLDVFVGSTPILLAGASRGIDFDLVSQGNEIRVDIRVQRDRQVLDVTGGAIGGLLRTRNGRINSTIDAMDDIARNLVFEVNRLHAVGHNAEGLLSSTSNLIVPV